MIKTIEERLEEQEEVLQLMLTKLQILENRKIEFPEIRIPNYNSQLEILKKELLRVNHSYPVEKIDEQVTKIQNLSGRIPETIKVRHHHHFDDKSKGFIIGAVVSLLVCVMTVSIAVSIWKENGRLDENSVKFRIIRQGYPNVAYWADTLYYHKPEETKQFIEQLEEEQSLAVRMQAIAKEKENAANESVKNLRKLKKRFKNTYNGN
jgi:hypothetical protein